jgi:DNA mismatch repair protein MSH2
MDQVWQVIDNESLSIAEDLSLELGKKLKFESGGSYGAHMRLPRAEAGKIRGKSAYIELATQKSGVLFTTKDMKKKSVEFVELSGRYDDAQKGLVRDIVDTTAEYFSVLEPMNDMIAHLDVLVSLAHVAVHAPIPYTRPVFGDMIDLKESRHACLELQDDVSFISNDAELEKGESSFQIITGM